MRIFERIAKNNIDLLSKRDILALMDEIIKTCENNVSKACNLVGIGRKTYYNWKKSSKSVKSKWSIKPECGKKVLSTALKLNPVSTLDKLTSKAFDKTCNLLYFTLSTIHGQILDSEDIKEKEKLVDEFIKLISKYNTSPVEHLNVEINDMLAEIKDKCSWYNYEQKLKTSTQLFEFVPEIKTIENEELKAFNCSIFFISSETKEEKLSSEKKQQELSVTTDGSVITNA